MMVTLGVKKRNKRREMDAKEEKKGKNENINILLLTPTPGNNDFLMLILIVLVPSDSRLVTARSSYASAVLGVVILSVRQSVSLSVRHTRAL